MNKSSYLSFLLLVFHYINYADCSMKICNASKYKLYVTLDQVGTLYWDVLQSGGCFYRNTGAVHFTVTANIVQDDFVPPTDFQNVMQHIKWVGVGASIAGMLAGNGAGAKAIGTFGGVASCVGEFAKYPRGYYELSSAGWYAGKHHTLSIYHNGEKLKIYSYHNQECYPDGCWESTKNDQRAFLISKGINSDYY